jgi:hypothetical protein
VCCIGKFELDHNDGEWFRECMFSMPLLMNFVVVFKRMKDKVKNQLVLRFSFDHTIRGV